MPVARLPNLASGADVFLDANVFIYAFSGLSDECCDLGRGFGGLEGALGVWPFNLNNLRLGREKRGEEAVRGERKWDKSN